MVENSLELALQERILILDGAMGTMLQAYNLQEEDYRGQFLQDHPQPLKGNNDLLGLTKPEVLKEIHRQYLEAGSDIITTCTFGAQRVSQADYGLEDWIEALNLGAVRAARQAVDEFLADPAHEGRQAWVGGSIGPTGKTLSMSPDVADAAQRNLEFDQLAQAYLEQILALQKGGVDLLMVETIFDALNAKAVIYAAEVAAQRTGKRLPLMLSVTLSDRSGRTLCGQTLEAFWASVAHGRPLLFGLNCALGAEEMAPHLEVISKLVNCAVSCYPNAGLPNLAGGYDETPEEMAQIMARYAKAGWLNAVGGCCGTSPQHIKALSQAVASLPPRTIHPERPWGSLVSGLEAYSLRRPGVFTLVGERCNLSGSAKFARLIKSQDWEEALGVARAQVERGANILDINVDDAMHDSAAVMEHFLRLVVTEPSLSLPLMIDSSRWDVLERALKNCPGRSLVNSISLKEGEDEFKRRAQEIRRLGGLVVVMAFDERGQGDTLARKKEIVDRACKILIEELGFAPQEIAIDLAVLAVATGMESHARYALDFLEALSYLQERWPGVMSNGGISNLSFALRGNNPVREAMHSVFLYYAVQRGLTMGIVNAGLLCPYQEIDPQLCQAIEDVLLDRDPQATERLLAEAEKHRGDKAKVVAATNEEWRQGNWQERLAQALTRGVSDYLESDLQEALEAGATPLVIIEEGLMAGMRQVGELFGAGQMFLPQVVKSARVMKRAVQILEPYFQGDSQQPNRGRVLMATVKGDVHDIGKNIVSVVLGCSGFQVEDLGVMVPTSEIVAKVQETGAQVVGLSALITPSLEEMVNVVQALDQAGLALPVLIGGAATSALHTAVKIAPHYRGPVVYVADASVATSIVAQLLDPASAPLFLAELARQQAQLRQEWEERLERLELRSWEEARSLAGRSPAPAPEDESSVARPQSLGQVVEAAYSLERLEPYIDWTEFLSAWGLKGHYPQILEDPLLGERARRLVEEAQNLWSEWARRPQMEVKGGYLFYPAYAKGEDIYLELPDGREKLLPTLRQQRSDLKSCLALADFVAPKGQEDYVGLFAVCVGEGWAKLQEELERSGDDYRKLMASFLADRAVEAGALLLHLEARRACGIEEESSLLELMLGRHRGIRPAPGYPACPDHALKRLIWELLEPGRWGMELTESCALRPASSIAGFYFNSPQARYFSLGKIDRQQVEDYARRTGQSLAEVERWLAPQLAYTP